MRFAVVRRVVAARARVVWRFGRGVSDGIGTRAGGLPTILSLAKVPPMSRFNAWLNAITIGLCLVGGAFVGVRFLGFDSWQEFSQPSDVWFRSAVLQRSQPVVVKFGASWCGPCRMLDPELDQLGHHGKIAVVRIDVGKHRDLAQHYRVSSIPHIYLFHHGSVVAQRIGYADHEQLRKWVASHTSM